MCGNSNISARPELVEGNEHSHGSTCSPRTVFDMRNRHGFTIIEILVAIALVALMATIVIPNLSKFSPRYERDAFIGNIASLVQFGWQSAMTSGKIHRVAFDFEKKTIQLLRATDAIDVKGEVIFGPVKTAYLATRISIPTPIQIKQFIVEGFDELGRYQGRPTAESWFYLMPDGLAQAVTINALDTRDVNDKKKPRQFSLVLNPFNARFKRYDTFQK